MRLLFLLFTGKINKFGSDYSFEEGKYGDTILFVNEKKSRVLE